MELDELKQAWQTLDRRLESRQALDDWMFLDLRAGRVRRSLRPLLWAAASGAPAAQGASAPAGGASAAGAAR